MCRDDADPDPLACRVGTIRLTCQARAIEDLHPWLVKRTTGWTWAPTVVVSLHDTSRGRRPRS